ncbi:phosphatidylinositol-glycan biosynthesis class W protein [Culicoides brevitarsis]|uniref:phosphatidylinositol-glycan biosynthesis class W protein n=1 Tax=Culicoides brevitarsis TaxID=469753 RepID=UPI00307B8D52
MDPQEYKTFHESFMVNNNGTSAFHTFLTIVPSFFTTFFYTLAVATNILTPRGTPMQFVQEFVILVMPIIASVTIVNSVIVQVNVALLVIVIPLIVIHLKNRIHMEPFVQIPTKQIQYLTVGRSVVNLISCICILAVDFQVFPRNLAKTETFGYGLMDTGVGLFVIINGAVSSEAQKDKLDGLNMKKVKKILLSTSPLIALGMLRFFLIKEINYQEHISEYGTHWNFFMTLASVKLFGSLLLEIFPYPQHAHYMAITCLCLHEMSLQLGLSQFVMSDASREISFFNANREGIISIPGYVTLYLFSIFLRNLVKFPNKNTIRPKDLMKVILKLFFIVIFLWKMIYVCERMFGISRRLANMGYCFWIASLGCTMVLLFMLLEIFILFVKFDQKDLRNAEEIVKDTHNQGMDRLKYVPLIFEAINFNALLFFLMANLLTGLLNMFFQTMLLSELASLLIIGYYAFTLLTFTVFLYVNKIKLKFW